ALADARGHVGELPAHDQDDRTGDTLAALRQQLAGGNLRGTLVWIERVFLACAGCHHARDHAAVALPEEGVHALARWCGAVEARKLDALAYLAADARCQASDRRLDRLGAVDPLGGGDGEFLRLVPGGQ